MIVNADRLHPFGGMAVEIVQREKSTVLLRELHNLSSDFSLVERVPPFGCQKLECPCEVGLAMHIPGLRGFAVGQVSAGAGGILGQQPYCPLPLFGDDLADREAL